MTEPGRQGATRRGASVRTRVLAGLVALLSLGFVVAGAALYSVQVAATNERIDTELHHAAEVFRDLAADEAQAGLSGERLLYLAIQRSLPAKNEGMVGLVNGRARWVAPGHVPLRIERDAELMRWAAATPTDITVLDSVRTATTTYRALSLPVVDASGASARLVYAFNYSADRARVDASFVSFAWVAAGTVLLMGLAGWFVVGRLLRPVRSLTTTARRITHENLGERIPVVGRDDLAELTRTVNGMLDRVEDAVGSQQRLLDDAGHELRTPITIVSGHLELMDPADPADAAGVRELALDELGRMSGLVDDLVTLAQVGTDRFVVPVPTQLGALLHDVAAKARVLGPREWSVAGGAGVARLDPRRVTQALLQLASNAVKYSEPGSPVEIGAAAEGREVRLWVKDRGRGVAAGEQQRIFERFARGAGVSRSDGAGLGLSIVAAIARAHGGRVEVDSAPGAGATFTLVLPQDWQTEAVAETTYGTATTRGKDRP